MVEVPVSAQRQPVRLPPEDISTGRAALEPSPGLVYTGLVYTAAAPGPLTSALLTLPQIREMMDRLFEAERPWLGELAA